MNYTIYFTCLVLLSDANRYYTGEYRCCISSRILLHLTFLLPIFIIIIIIMCNLILFVFIKSSVFHHSSTIMTYKNKSSKRKFGGVLYCLFPVGKYRKKTQENIF